VTSLVWNQEEDVLDLDLTGWLLVGVCAVLTGVSKTGLPGLGILVVPLMAMAFPSTRDPRAFCWAC
jgi:hypothetical protein